MKNKITKLTLSEDITSFLKKNKFLSKDDNTFNYNTDLFDYGYLDSFGIVQLILFIEKKYKCDLVPIYIERRKNNYFKMFVSEPIKIGNSKSIKEITEHLNKILEKMILKNVDQWIWTHDRWKK